MMVKKGSISGKKMKKDPLEGNALVSGGAAVPLVQLAAAALPWQDIKRHPKTCHMLKPLYFFVLPQ